MAIPLSFILYLNACGSEGNTNTATTTGLNPGESQFEMNESAGEKALKAKQKMNALFNQVLTKHKEDKVFTEKATIAQKQWEAYANAQWDMKFPHYENAESGTTGYGSVGSMCSAEYRAELYDARIKELTVWVEGVPEGDACSGSVGFSNNTATGANQGESGNGTSEIKGTTQGEMNASAGNIDEKAEQKMNTLFNQILNKYKEDKFFTEKAKIAQKQWGAYAKAQLKMKYPNSEDSAVEPMCAAMYRTELCNARIKELNIWMEGIAEGDVCSGSVGNKQ